MFILLQKAAQTSKLMKYRFLINTIDYFGHIIRPGNLRNASHATDVINQLKEPHNMTGMRSFSGPGSVFKQFVLSRALIAALRNWKLQKDRPNDFGNINDKEQNTMKILFGKIDLTTHASPTLRRRALQARYKCVWRTIWLYSIAGETQQYLDISWIFASIPNKCREGVRKTLLRLFGGCMVGTFTTTFPRKDVDLMNGKIVTRSVKYRIKQSQ